jgi:hypothetical protein
MPAESIQVKVLIDRRSRTGRALVCVTPAGRAGFAFVERNQFGVLDHVVTLPSGE